MSVLLLPCVLAAQSPSSAPGDATITGTVVDQSGTAIAAAAVSAKEDTNGTVGRAITDAAGHYTIASLAAGSYTLEVRSPNFATSRRDGVKLSAGQTLDIPMSLTLAALPQTVTVEASVSLASEAAPSQNSLEARSAESRITGNFVQNFTSPVSDYTEILNMAPGTFGINPNGIGLGDSKTFFRGFADGQYTMTYDGIPFEDTNTPTHHSWAFIPGQWIGGATFDRSPGSAATIGPTNFGGSINLLSRPVQATPDIRATYSYGSYDTALYDLNIDSGQFGNSNLTMDLHQMKSDGYQTYNNQKRDGGFLKYQWKVNANTTITLFGGLTDLFTNTPKNSPTRSQLSQFGWNYLMSGDPTAPNYYGFSTYHVETDFEYIGISSNLGGGWRFDNKVYTYRYWNKQFYNNSTTTINATSAIDKLNGYRKIGDVAYLTYESNFGVLRTGLWYEWAYTDRYQIPSSPLTHVDTPAPNFHEHFLTSSVQPFVEYEFKITPRFSVTAGVKDAFYNMALNQYQDNGKTVGCLGGTYNKTLLACVGGVDFVHHNANYNSWLPSLDARYFLKDNWSVYAQFAEGSVIPPSGVFDVSGAQVGVLPSPTVAKTYQAGSVWKFNRFTLDLDGYYTHFQNAYAMVADQTGNENYYQTGPSNTKGVEAETNIFIGHGFNLYLNGTVGQAKYQSSGLWVANTPGNTGTVGVTYQYRNWDAGIFDKHIGSMWNDNGTYNQAIPIDAFSMTNLFVNYTIKGDSVWRGTKLRLSVNNLLDKHYIVGDSAANAGPNPASSPNDQLTVMPARAVMFAVTFGFAPAHR
ncbi:MAG TPA: TonB-dependent receptor [Bryobacteraceae bacterium]|jgi:iron complex outermembrane receptor protein|nr:TonB-dependent receptor [Bryobacteraceae bacterium]